MKINIKNSVILCIILVIITSLFVAGCSPLTTETNPNEDTPLFPGDTSKAQAKEYMLYFQLLNENYIVPELRTLTIPESKSIEQILIQELISGPKDNSTNIINNINTNTRVVSVSGNEDVLFVTLSNQFLSPPKEYQEKWDEEQEVEDMILKTRKMALYAMVNTVTELGRYSFVQFYIDYDSNGTGTRPTRKEMGFVGEGETQLIEPLSRDTNIIFSPKSSILTIMNSVIEKNWAEVTKYTSYSENLDADINELIRQLELSNLSLLDYSITSETISLNGDYAVVVLSYSFESVDGTENSNNNISVKLILENGIWKCSIESLNQILLGDYS